MKLKNTLYPLVKLPSDAQVTIFLIREELKIRKFFHAFDEVGFDDCYFRPHLESLILRSLDMDDDRDEVFDMYYEIIERRSKKVEADHESVMKQAMKAYVELVSARKKLYPEGG